MMLYICTKSRENIFNRFQSYGADTISVLKITKGHNSVKIVGRVMVLVLCTSSDDALHLYQVS